MNKRYIVTLTDEERKSLERLVAEGKTQGYRIRHAQILLELDMTSWSKGWTQDRIGEAYGARHTTVSNSNIAKRHVEAGMETALGRKVQMNRHRKVDGRIQAQSEWWR